MTVIVQRLLETFDSLPDADKHQAAIEILRRYLGAAEGDVPDGTLLSVANELFRNLDAEEAGHASR